MNTQAWMFRGLIVAGLVLGLVLPAQATLMGRLAMTPGGTDYQAYYDDDLMITWAADANINGLRNWSAANTWAMNVMIGGVTGWRLPTADPSCGVSMNCTNSEMGHLYFTELGNTSVGLTNTGPFSNIQSGRYWSGTQLASNNASAWSFRIGDGLQEAGSKGNGAFAWAVHAGDVSAPAAVPEPGTLLLMGSGLVGLLGWRHLRRSC